MRSIAQGNVATAESEATVLDFVNRTAVVDVTEHTLGDIEHVEAARAYIAQLNANRESTPLPMWKHRGGSEL